MCIIILIVDPIKHDLLHGHCSEMFIRNIWESY